MTFCLSLARDFKNSLDLVVVLVIVLCVRYGRMCFHSVFRQYLKTFIPWNSQIIYLCSMTKEERILRFKWPDRTEFTAEEIREVRRLLSRDDEKDESAARLPSKFVEVGRVVPINGVLYRCVEASRRILTDPCLGCDLRESNCTSKVPQCSPFDRRDRRRVWFRRVEG